MDSATEALNAAYKLLSRRAYSEKALREKLQKKGISQAKASAVVRKLKAQRLLSDPALAAAMAESRIKGRLWGSSRAEMDLVRKGISRELAREAVREAGASGEAPSEEERAYELIQKRARQITRSTEDATFKRKIFGYLARRGFDPETIEAALERYISRHSHESGNPS